MRRIIVVGNSGSGKSTLARALAARLNIPCIETDAIFHLPGWKELDGDEFRQKLDEATREGDWVLDGNYIRFTRNIVWPRADTIIWLDYHLLRVVFQVTRRTFTRLLRRSELWNGNRETWRGTFSRESIILWAITMHSTYRSTYERLLPQEALRGKKIVHLKSPREAAEWLTGLRVPETAQLRPS